MNESDIDKIWHESTNSKSEGDMISKFAHALEDFLLKSNDKNKIERLSDSNILIRFKNKEECDYFIEISNG